MLMRQVRPWEQVTEQLVEEERRKSGREEELAWVIEQLVVGLVEMIEVGEIGPEELEMGEAKQMKAWVEVVPEVEEVLVLVLAQLAEEPE